MIKSLKENFVLEIKKLKTLLASEKIQFYLNAVEIQPNRNYEILENEIKLLNKNDKIYRIKNALKSKNLFHFPKEELIVI